MPRPPSCMFAGTLDDTLGTETTYSPGIRLNRRYAPRSSVIAVPAGDRIRRPPLRPRRYARTCTATAGSPV